MQTTPVAISHARFNWVDPTIFVCRLVADCMTHTCSLKHKNNTIKLDACCQYGADVDIAERDAILSHSKQLRSILNESVRDLPWFTDDVIVDKDFPTGAHVRTQTTSDEAGCVFLQHSQRGCAIHRAAIEGNWNMEGIKPNICRLFPITYTDQSIVMSDDYLDYSCAYDADAPSVYRVSRQTLASVFDHDLIKILDKLETNILAQASLNDQSLLTLRLPNE